VSNSYIGRFAPSPTGPLHAGSLVAAVASYLDARAHDGVWLVRIEDIDEGRSVPGAAEGILELLHSLGMHADREVVWQSRRKHLYQAAFDALAAHAYPCGCNRREIADSRLGFAPDGGAIYPGTCREGLAPGRTTRSLRLRVPEPGADTISFSDRFAGHVSQRLASESGDFVLKRADGYWAYQLAVVVDDADQGVTDIVRGADLLDSTPRQIFLQRVLGMCRSCATQTAKNSPSRPARWPCSLETNPPRWQPCWTLPDSSDCPYSRPIRSPASGKPRSQPGATCLRCELPPTCSPRTPCAGT
jgi:glutamyl-Q tRNA(Asp) synthetase